MILANGATALLSHGNKNEGIVLAKYGNEYVVWNYYLLPAENKYDTQHGNYFRDSVDAAKKFVERSARYE
jgi:hypothetical protein